MGENEVKLFSTWASPFGHRIEHALKLKGIAYEYIEEDLTNKSLQLLKYNPVHKKVPVLVHNGNAIAESLVILEYIDETWPNNPLLPKHPYDKAMAHFWAKFIDETIIQTASKFRSAKDKEERDQVLEQVCEKVKLLDNELQGKEFFGGESSGYVNIVALYTINWLQVRQEFMQLNALNEDKFPHLYKWLGKLQNTDLVKECMPPRDKHLAYIRARFEAAAKSTSK